MEKLLRDLEEHKTHIGIIGLGYVGLPLACLLAEKFKVLGFDIDPGRVSELRDGLDRTKEIESQKALLNANLAYTCKAEDLRSCRVFVVAVPTPIDQNKKPDLLPLISASKVIGKHMPKGALVIYESTVYPGVTEKECRETLENESGLTYQKDFFLGYSPERVNPGDKVHTIEKVIKVVSGSTPEALDLVDKIYGSVIRAGTHRAPNIATAEAAKVIENTQRDLNIALVNELSRIFSRIGLDTHDVLAAAGTKWNFLKFQPGLVGGHCIGVDPYYLTYLAEGLGYLPQVILAGRRINDDMGYYVAENTVKLMLKAGIKGKDKLRVAICGVTFKEDVPDLRNTRVIDIVEGLESSGVEVYCVDPVCEAQDFFEHYNRPLTVWEKLPTCDAVIIAVKHKEFVAGLSIAKIQEKLHPQSQIIVDVKGVIDRTEAKNRNVTLWRI